MAKVCTHPDCNNPRFSKGLCQWHRVYESKKPKKPNKAIKRTPIKKMSDKTAKLNKVYSVACKQFKKDHPVCQYEECKAPTQDVHHMAGRGINLLNQSTWLAVCRGHHTYIHLNPRESRKSGYLT